MSTLAVVVLSGGLDSATALGIAVKRHDADNVHAVSFNYGQKHTVELKCARHLADYYGITHAIYNLPASMFVGGVLTSNEEVPDMRYDDLPSGVMSPTYVPFRNGNLLAQATAYADSVLRDEDVNVQGRSTGPDPHPGEPIWEDALLYAGMHSEDGAGFAYADCTPEFLGAMASAIYVGTYGRVRLQALFQFMTKDAIIFEGIDIGVPYRLTHSCYRGERPACGRCSTCHARLDAFAKVGVVDPIEYEEGTNGR